MIHVAESHCVNADDPDSTYPLPTTLDAFKDGYAMERSLAATVHESSGRPLQIDARRQARRQLRLTAQIDLPNGRVMQGHTADISREGIGFFLSFPIEVGSDCTLNLPIEACGDRVVLRLTGRVCHCSRQQLGEIFRIGMQFVRMDERTAEIIDAALR